MELTLNLDSLMPEKKITYGGKEYEVKYLSRPAFAKFDLCNDKLQRMMTRASALEEELTELDLKDEEREGVLISAREELNNEMNETFAEMMSIPIPDMDKEVMLSMPIHVMLHLQKVIMDMVQVQSEEVPNVSESS